MMRILLAGLLVLATITIPPRMAAQRLSESRTALTVSGTPAPAHGASASPSASRTDGTDASTLQMLYTGFMSGALGLLGGGALGYQFRSCTPDEWFCGMKEALVGASIGEVIMLPVGVHLNGKNTSLGSKIGLSVAILLAGVAAAPATDGVSLLAVPPAQLFATITMEHRAAKRARTLGDETMRRGQLIRGGSARDAGVLSHDCTGRTRMC